MFTLSSTVLVIFFPPVKFWQCECMMFGSVLLHGSCVTLLIREACHSGEISGAAKINLERFGGGAVMSHFCFVGLSWEEGTTRKAGNATLLHYSMISVRPSYPFHELRLKTCITAHNISSFLFHRILSCVLFCFAVFYSLLQWLLNLCVFISYCPAPFNLIIYSSIQLDLSFSFYSTPLTGTALPVHIYSFLTLFHSLLLLYFTLFPSHIKPVVFFFLFFFI